MVYREEKGRVSGWEQEGGEKTRSRALERRVGREGRRKRERVKREG